MAFLFGSVSKNKQISESDIDVAVWLKDGYTTDEIDKLWNELELLLHKSVDLIVLNQAYPTVAWSAMRGEKIIIRDYKLFIAKMLEISTEAEDMQDFVIDLFKLREKSRRESV